MNAKLSLMFSPNLSQSSDTTGETRKRFSGIAYSGGVIPNYGSFGDVAIDLSTLKIPNKRLFSLVNHDSDQRAGSLEAKVENGTLMIDGTFFSSDSGRQVSTEFGDGAPWELSVGISGKPEKFNSPKTLELNGQSLTVNAIYRNARLLEVSFVPAGADPSTEVSTFQVINETDRPAMEQTIEDVLCSLRWMLNLPKLATPEEIKAELDKVFNRLSTITQVNPSSGMNAMVDNFEAQQKTMSEQTISLQESTQQFSEKLSIKEQRIAELEAELKGMYDKRRLDDVKSLFSSIHREFSDEAAKPYLDLSEDAFTLLAKDLKSFSVKIPDAFFHEAHERKEVATDPKISDMQKQLLQQVSGQKG